MYNEINLPPFNIRDEAKYNKTNNNAILKIVVFCFLIFILLFITSSSSFLSKKLFHNMNLKSYFIPNTYRLPFIFWYKTRNYKIIPFN